MIVLQFLQWWINDNNDEWMNEWNEWMNKMNENARILSAFENRLRADFV